MSNSPSASAAPTAPSPPSFRYLLLRKSQEFRPFLRREVGESPGEFLRYIAARTLLDRSRTGLGDEGLERLQCLLWRNRLDRARLTQEHGETDLEAASDFLEDIQADRLTGVFGALERSKGNIRHF